MLNNLKKNPVNTTDMNHKITIAVVIAFLVYALYSWWSIPQYDGFDLKEPEAHAAVELPVQREPAQERVMSPSGPNSPGQQAPKESIVVPSEEPYDPEAQSYESAEHPERLRHPERLYGPGLEQDDQVTAVESGIASNSYQKTMHAYQSFGPEFAQNGGAFMENGVVANDSSLNMEYSSV
jgi:hypothetical protein